MDTRKWRHSSTIIEGAGNKGNVHFTKDTSRVFLNSGGGNLISVRWDGTDEKVHAKITGITTYGSNPDEEEHGMEQQAIM